MPKTNFIFFCLLVSFQLSLAQSHQLTGQITDSLQQALPNTNVIASPLNNPDAGITFSISSTKGQYKLNLADSTSYLIEITHLGFKKVNDTIQLSADLEKNYQMQPSTTSLEEVIIQQEMAVVVKEDTITYRTDQFKTGEERKLRDILKKLPGLEVDKAGNVTVNGKPVTKLMVDGKTFFTGDEKLGVNNIPADAVDEVEALDNYSDVAFLKGLEDSDQLALNIKLKEGKKKFAFGDIQAGGGVEDRFLFHPKLFYYSPNTAINLIADVNNIGQKSFTVQDYIDFEGGLGLSLEDPSAYFSLYRDDFAQFLQNTDFVYNKNDFVAGSISQRLGAKTNLDAYSIFNKSKQDQLNQQDIAYQTGNQANEFRDLTTQQRLLFSINKIKLRYSDINTIDLRANTTVKYNEGNQLTNLNSTINNSTEFVNTLAKPDQVEVSQVFNLNKQFSYKHTTKVEATLSHKEQNTNRLWDFNQAIFSDLIPLVNEDETYNLNQDVYNRLNSVKLNAKHYWVLADFHHVYPKAGFRLFQSDYNTLDEQILNNGNRQSFQNANFNNRLDFSLSTPYAGFQYKTQIGKLVLRPGIVYQLFDWKAQQYQIEIANETQGVWLPELFVEYEFNNSEKLKLEYNRRSNFSNVNNFANRLRLTNFNQLYQGNANLENQIYNSLRLFYSSFSLFKGLNYNLSANYNYRESSIRNQTEIEGIDQVVTSIFTDLPEERFLLSGNITKRIPDFSFGLSGNANWSNYSRIINQSVIDYQSNSYAYNVRVRTRFDDLPNLTLNMRHSFSELNSTNLKNKFTRWSPDLELEYDFWTDFIFNFNYNYTYFKNNTTNNSNRFELADASLYYNKESSPWAFELSATNLFDIDFRRENSLSEFTAIDRRTFIQPRTFLLSISYKL